MAATVSNIDSDVWGSRRMVLSEVTFDATYPTGGEAVTPSQLGLVEVDFAIVTIKSATGAGVNVANAYYNAATDKILLYDETPAQVANAADVSTTVVNVVAIGH